MKKTLTSKVLRNAATTEGIATIGGAGVGGWLGSSVGLAGFCQLNCITNYWFSSEKFYVFIFNSFAT